MRFKGQALDPIELPNRTAQNPHQDSPLQGEGIQVRGVQFRDSQ